MSPRQQLRLLELLHVQPAVDGRPPQDAAPVSPVRPRIDVRDFSPGSLWFVVSIIGASLSKWETLDGHLHKKTEEAPL